MPQWNTVTVDDRKSDRQVDLMQHLYEYMEITSTHTKKDFFKIHADWQFMDPKLLSEEVSS